MRSVQFEGSLASGHVAMRGSQYTPHKLASALSNLTRNLPGCGCEFRVEHLPAFACLVGNDQTSTCFNDDGERGILAHVTSGRMPCKQTLNGWDCNPPHWVCTDSHDKALCQRYPCLRAKQGKMCDPRRCSKTHSGSPFGPGGDNVVYHMCLGRFSKDRSVSSKSRRIASFAIAAQIAATPGLLAEVMTGWERDHPNVLLQFRAGMLAYDLSDAAFQTRQAELDELRKSHEAVVWDAEGNRPNSGEATVLVKRVVNLPTPKCDPSGDDENSNQAA